MNRVPGFTSTRRACRASDIFVRLSLTEKFLLLQKIVMRCTCCCPMTSTTQFSGFTKFGFIRSGKFQPQDLYNFFKNYYQLTSNIMITQIRCNEASVALGPIWAICGHGLALRRTGKEAARGCWHARREFRVGSEERFPRPRQNEGVVLYSENRFMFLPMSVHPCKHLHVHASCQKRVMH